jgi:hypothetical protein
MKLRLKDIPSDFEVKPLRAGASAKNPTWCGSCGLSWDDDIVTGITPAPSGRCPFERFHRYSSRKSEVFGAYFVRPHHE